MAPEAWPWGKDTEGPHCMSADASANRQVEMVEFTVVVMGSKAPSDPVQALRSEIGAE